MADQYDFYEKFMEAAPPGWQPIEDEHGLTGVFRPNTMLYGAISMSIAFAGLGDGLSFRCALKPARRVRRVVKDLGLFRLRSMLNRQWLGAHTPLLRWSAFSDGELQGEYRWYVTPEIWAVLPDELLLDHTQRVIDAIEMYAVFAMQRVYMGVVALKDQTPESLDHMWATIEGELEHDGILAAAEGSA